MRVNFQVFLECDQPMESYVRMWPYLYCTVSPIEMTCIIKARDQKQIYRLNETMSHWGLNPPPLAE